MLFGVYLNQPRTLPFIICVISEVQPPLVVYRVGAGHRAACQGGETGELCLIPGLYIIFVSPRAGVWGHYHLRIGKEGYMLELLPAFSRPATESGRRRIGSTVPCPAISSRGGSKGTQIFSLAENQLSATRCFDVELVFGSLAFAFDLPRLAIRLTHRLRFKPLLGSREPTDLSRRVWLRRGGRKE